MLRPGLTLSDRWSAILTATPAIGIVVVCSILPLAWMALIIVLNPSVRSELRFDAFRVGLMERTLGYNAAAAVIATAMGLPAGYVLGRGRGMAARVLWVTIPAALIMPSLSYAYGWSQFTRIIKPIFRWIGEHPIHVPEIALLHIHQATYTFPFETLFRPSGTADVIRCIWSLGSWLWAVPACLIGLSLRRMDTAVQQQALLDGALRRVTFRQLLGPIVASIAIVTVLATQEFAVYEPTGISVVATEVRMVFDTGSVSSVTNSIMAPNPSSQRAGFRSPEQAGRAAAAVVTAAPLLLATILLAIIAGWGASRSSASDTLQVGDWPPALDASPATVKVTWFLIALNIGVPVASLLASLSRFSPAIAWKQFSPLVGGAMEVALAATIVALIAAMSSAGRWTRGLLAVSGASFLVGGQLLAIGLIRIFNHGWLDWIYNTGALAVIAYAGRFGWIAIGAGRSTWSPPWKELRDVAAVDGAPAMATAVHVIWPLAWPVLLAGGLMVGALSLTEVPATVLLMPQNPQVLTPTLMTWVHMVRYDAMIEASLLMMATVLLPAVAAVLLTGFGLKASRRGWVRPK